MGQFQPGSLLRRPEGFGNGERKAINRTYLVYVAIDAQDRPVPVPPFVPLTEEERMEYEAALQRREQRLARGV